MGLTLNSFYDVESEMMFYLDAPPDKRAVELHLMFVIIKRHINYGYRNAD
jgi:hypothetical protein